MKNFMKLGAVVLAIVMVLSMSVTAFATSLPESLTSGKVGSDAGTALVRKVNIAKSLNVTNPDETVINAPAISYSYSIAGVAAGQSITDKDNVQAITRAVPSTLPTLSGTAANTIAWTTSDQVSASSSGTTENVTASSTVNTKYLTVDFSSVTFSQAGVYRYVITETVLESAYTNSGVTRGASGTASGTPAQYTETRYLDVYVKDTTTAGDTIYGYVLTNANNDNIDDHSDPKVGVSSKVDCFTADNYVTSNVTIGKTLTGDAFMNDHQFPFNVAFSGTTVAYTEMKKETTVGSTTTSADMTAGAGTDFVKIKTGDSVKYIGIPAGTTVAVYETNDVSGTTYKSSATTTGGTVGTNATNAAAKNITWTTTPTAYAAYSEKVYNSNQASVTTTGTATNFTEPFTNALELISPTGVVMRVAPFAIMLGVGLFLVLFSRRRKNQAEA